MLSSSEASPPVNHAGLSRRARLVPLVIVALLPATLGLASYLLASTLLMLAAWLASVALLVWTIVMAVAQRRVGTVDARPESVQAPRASQLQAADSLENLPVGVVVHGPDTAVLSTNPKASGMLGLRAEQLRGKLAGDPCWRFCRSDGSPMPVLEYPVSQVLASGQALHDMVIGVGHAQDGPPLWLLCNAELVRGEQGQIEQVVVVLVDITGRQQAQQAQQRVQERLELVLRGMDEAPWDWDLQSGEVYLAPSWWHMLGYEIDELPAAATLWASLCHPDDAPDVDAALSTALKGDASTCQWECRLRHKQGHYVPVLTRAHVSRDAQGKALRLSGVNADLTERRKTQAQLQESEGRYRALVEWSPVGIAVHQNGLIVYTNPATVRMLGADSAQQLVGTPIVDRVHPDYLQPVVERIGHTLATHDPMPWREEKLLRLDGMAVDVEIQGTRITHLGEPAIQVSVVDITHRKQIESTLRESEARFRALTELSSDWYWEQDEEFRFVILSGDVAASTGLSASQHAGKRRWELPALNLSESDWQRHRAVLQAHQSFRDFEIRRPDTGGRMHWASVSGVPKFDSNGVFRGYRGIGRDVTPQKQAADQIHRLAFYDALTGLPNRRLLIEQLKKAVQINVRHGLRGALLFIDLDNFKTLNDTLGHDVGDVLLQQVAKRLVECVREADTVARLGGDEFVVVLEDLDVDVLEAAAEADAVGQKILNALNAPYQLAGREHRSSPSIGVTLFGAQDHGVDELLKQADLAMYQAKGAGRNTLRFFDAGMQSEVDGRVALESDLRDGLHGGEELTLRYQPVVGVDGRVIGAEALVRWLQPQRGLVMPADFIPLAESTGLILPLGRWVMQEACEQLAVWAYRTETAHLTLAVNVSARELREPDFVQQVLQMLKRTGAPPSRLRLELTESVLAHRVEDIIAKMSALKRHGIGFSLDDFGTGYSSLSYLKRLPLDLLKIDRSFVRDVLTDPNDAAIARTIVALGHSLGLSVVAEGVETEAQCDFLAANGCFIYQGYLYGAPMPIAEFDAFVVRGV
ncbi:MAG: EAL domain-containing protein [Rhodoferax sp.]|nr:EAL domain-containing protein [Rhodoferax sp.]